VQNRLLFTIVARDARLRWDLIGANCECTTLYLGVVSTFSYSGRSVARQQLLATSLRLDNNRAPLGAGNFCAPGLLLVLSGLSSAISVTIRARALKMVRNMLRSLLSTFSRTNLQH
jgi:hypothetical protein